MYNKYEKGGFMDNKFKSAVAFGGFIIFVIIMGIFSSSEDEIILQETEIENTIADSNQQIESGEEEKIFVYIIGAVNKPGIVEAKVNSRLYEIVELAGGFTENADETAINLASTLRDEEKIIVPYKESSNKEKEIEKINQLYNTNVNKTTDKININTATVEQLQTLSGIGKSTAEKIVNYRKENSKFEKIEDIKNVSGIGEAKFNSIKDKIVVK